MFCDNKFSTQPEKGATFFGLAIHYKFMVMLCARGPFVFGNRFLWTFLSGVQLSCDFKYLVSDVIDRIINCPKLLVTGTPFIQALPESFPLFKCIFISNYRTKKQNLAQ